MRRGNLFVISAPSGAGKTTLCHKLCEVLSMTKRSVSYTTRHPRPGEANDIDYTFVDEEEFRKMIEGGEFVEWAQVHGNFYGTSKRRLEEATCAGYDVLLDIDVQGARQLKRVYPESVHIFILPPSMQELRRRLTGRMSDSEAEAERRLKKARDEVKEYRSYEYVIVNNDLEQALVLLSSILLAERARIGRADCHWINETFP